MYTIKYHWSNYITLAHFDDYDVCKKVYDYLKEKYKGKGIIIMEKVSTVTSLDEFIDTVGGISNYDRD